jgi:hypothetical protein
MPGFTSLDDLIAEMTAGKFKRTDWNKATHATGNQAAGIWYALAHALGNPTAWVPGVVGTNLAWHGLSDRSTGAILHGGDVSTDLKYIVNASIFGAGVAPSVWMLVDMLGWYPVNTVTTTGDQALINSKDFTCTSATPAVLTLAATWDMQEGTCIRLTNVGGALPAGLSTATNYYWHRTGAGTGNVSLSRALLDAATYVATSGTGTGTHTATMYLDRYPDGKGVQAFITPSAALNTGTPNIQLTYTNTTPTAGRVTPTTLPISNASAPIGQIEYSGTAAGKYGPFMPLAAADQGILSVQQFNYNVTHGAGGVTNVVLCKPLLTLPITTASVVTERDLLNQVPSLPQVKDGAYLAWIMMAGGTTVAASQFYGHLDFAWG